MSGVLPRGLSRAFSRQCQADDETEDARATISQPGGLLWTLRATGAWRIFPLLLLSIMGIALLIPVLPIVITEFFAERRSGGEVVNCASFPPRKEPMACQDAHSDSVAWSSYTSFVSQTLLSFFLSPLVGRMSDQYGRKPFLMISTVLSMLPLVVFFLNYYGLISLLWWYPATAGMVVVDKMSLSIAFCADLMPPSLRAPTIGFVTATLAGAIFVAPLISAWFTLEQVVWMLPVFAGLSILWACFMVPESTSEDSRVAARAAAEQIRLQNPTGPGALLSSLLSTWSIVMRSRLFLTLTVIMMMVGIVQEGIQDLIMQYLQIKVSFGVADNAAVMQVIGIGGLVSQLFLLRPMLSLMGEKWVLFLALCCQAVQQVLLALASTKPSVWIALCVGVVGMMSFPTLSAIKSNNSAEHEQGAVQGALFGAKALAAGLGPLLFSPIFTAFTRSDSNLPFFPGAPFLLGCSLMVLSSALAITLPVGTKTMSAILVYTTKRAEQNNDMEEPLRGTRDADVDGCDPWDDDTRDDPTEPRIECYYGPAGDRSTQGGTDVAGESAAPRPPCLPA